MKRIALASLMLAAGTVPSIALAHSERLQRPCQKLFTPTQGRRAANVIYRGTRHVTLLNLRRLGYIERCQQDPRMQPQVRSYDRARARDHDGRIAAASRPTGWSPPWDCIARYESGGDPHADTGNSYFGGLQFSMQTWEAYGGRGNPADASIAEQEAIAERVLYAQGWGAWPNSSAMCGL